MGISFLGNTPDFKTWFFIIDGKTFVANNSSTLSPLRMSFTGGRFLGTYKPNEIIPGVVLVKNHSFDIITGTSVAKEKGEYIGIVEWTWAGQKYRNAWKLFEGDVIIAGVPEEGVPDTFSYDLNIIRPPTTEGYVPYDGPTGGAIGTGIASSAVVNASQTGGGSTTPSGGSTTPSSGGLLNPFVVTSTGRGSSATAVTSIPPTAAAGTDWVKLALQAGAAYLLFT